jgi:DNA-binding NarL/FixJ family response regulator
MKLGVLRSDSAASARRSAMATVEIAALVAKGLSNRDVAEAMSLSV